MATYTRAGSFLLAAELAKDPFGSLNRGVQPAGAAFDKHVLIRLFSDELFQAGMGTRAADIEKVLPLLGNSRAFGQNYRYEGGKAPVCVCDYVPGRSLGQLIEKAQMEQLPFGVDHALSVIQGVAQAVVQMHSKGLTHGLLSPHSIWVSFEGAAQIIDAPYAAAMKSYLPRATGMQTWLAPYLQLQGATPLQQDLFGVGAILYELLTFKKLPLGDLQGAIASATLKAAQEDGPVPAEIKAFLTRLLVPGNPFNSVESFNAELERVLYDGDYSPTTFNMAFFMHTLFRDENERDGAAMKAEQADNFTAYTAAGEALRSGATRSQHIEGFDEEEAKKGKNRIALIGAAAVVVLGIGGYFLYSAGKSKSDDANRAALLEVERMKAELAQQKADLDAQASAAQQKTQQIQQQLSTTTSAAEKAALQKQLEDQQKKQQELEARKQKVAAAQQQTEQKAEQIAKVAKVEPPPPPPAPKPEPKPEPVQQAPTPAAPTPAPTPAAPLQQAPATLTESPATVASRATPAIPARARMGAAWGPYREVTVQLRVFVDETGRPLKVTILKGAPINLGFDDAASNAAMQSQYTPAQRNGQPARGTVELVYEFKR
ncbi:MAG: energy transducer TonB [Acidobacteria bacterium]|nr:energy transducer TonB [Acidobacteriota bacterium]